LAYTTLDRLSAVFYIIIVIIIITSANKADVL